MPSKIRLFTYGHSSTIPLNILGAITVNIECNGKQIPANFIVINNRGTGFLLGHKSASQLDLLRVTVSIQPENIS